MVVLLLIFCNPSFPLLKYKTDILNSLFISIIIQIINLIIIIYYTKGDKYSKMSNSDVTFDLDGLNKSHDGVKLKKGEIGAGSNKVSLSSEDGSIKVR